MASKSSGAGPDEDERKNPGDTSTEPSGVSSDEPAEGDEESSPRQPGSPSG